MDRTQLEWSDSDTEEHSSDRDFIDNSTTIVTSAVNTKLDDDHPSTLVDDMDSQTRQLYLEKLLEDDTTTSTVRRSNRKRRRPSTWFEKHQDDLKVYLEDSHIDDLVESDTNICSDDSASVYSPSQTSDSDSNSDSDSSDSENSSEQGGGS